MDSTVSLLEKETSLLQGMREEPESMLPMNHPNGHVENRANHGANASNGVKNASPSKDEDEDEEEGDSTDADTSGEEEGQPLESDALIALTNLEFGGTIKRKRNAGEDWKPINGKKRKKKKKATEQSQRKSKWLVAAVQVLTEESEKGIYAMGVSQIWTKIRDAGLMDFQGKTPRNSLSSALSAAKSKGSNSIIVYNEGLYALRKYKHKLEEGRVKNICWETLPEEDLPKSTHFQWVGGSIYKKGNRTYFGAVRVDGLVFRVGETAHFTSVPNNRPHLGHIMALYEDDSGASVEVIWYFFPEDTHCGRIEDHLRDEVFMGESKDTASVESIESKAEVLCHNDYNKRSKQANLLRNIYFCRALYRWESNTFQSLSPDEDIRAAIQGSPWTNGDIRTNGDHRIEKKPKLTELQVTQSELQAKSKALDKANLQIEALRRENEQLKNQVVTGKKTERALPNHWPSDIIYTPTPIWDSLASDVKQKVCSECIEDVEIRPVTKKSHPAYVEGQLGLFTKTDLNRDTIIGEFSGYVQQRLDGSSKQSTVLFSDNSVTVEIDASRAGNETRFINDFRGKEAEPNVQYKPMRFGGCWHVIVVACKDIGANQEIIADLGATRRHENAAS